MQVQLWDLPRLTSLFLDNYKDLPEEVADLAPMRQIWVLVRPCTVHPHGCRPNRQAAVAGGFNRRDASPDRLSFPRSQRYPLVQLR
jgi:hypothetical protein